MYISDGQPLDEAVANWHDGEPNNAVQFAGTSEEIDEDGVVSVYKPPYKSKWNDNRINQASFHVVCELL